MFYDSRLQPLVVPNPDTRRHSVGLVYYLVHGSREKSGEAVTLRNFRELFSRRAPPLRSVFEADFCC